MSDEAIPEEAFDADRLIHVMPETLANKIAAGEVVQRPASAAKELIENALDAGAKQVTVIARAAGSELLQVIDDGCGMSPADASACLKRHATSKIRSIEDLERIHTLGFRGEAMASIAAVARVELRTKRVSDAAGTLVRVEGGEEKEVAPCATQNGTSVAVRNLFYNVPARRNFLKTPATELRHLVETVQFLALSNPRTAFTLQHDDHDLYRVAAASGGEFFEQLRTRIRDLFSEEHATRLIPVAASASGFEIRGFIGTPDFHRRSRGEQFLFINGRYVRDRSLDHAIFSGYGDLLPERSYPFFALFLDLDPRHVDVNVHPTKAEVKFDDERGIYAFVRSTIRRAVGDSYLTPLMEVGDSDEGEADEASTFRSGESAFRGSAPAEAPRRTPEGEARSWSPPRTFSVPSTGSGGFPSFRPESPTPSKAPGALSEELYGPGELPLSTPPHRGTPSPEGRVPAADAPLWQLHERYILTVVASGLVLIDQSAAHERILYERAQADLRQGTSASQQLLFPLTIDLNPADFELVGELIADLRALGFDLEPLSGRSVLVRGIPAELKAQNEQALLEDVLEQYKSFREKLQLRGRDNLAKSIARRGAVRPGTRLSPQEMRSLVDGLFACEMPYACPHGRPTTIRIPREELDRRFERMG